MDLSLLGLELLLELHVLFLLLDVVSLHLDLICHCFCLYLRVFCQLCRLDLRAGHLFQCRGLGQHLADHLLSGWRFELRLDDFLLHFGLRRKLWRLDDGRCLRNRSTSLITLLFHLLSLRLARRPRLNVLFFHLLGLWHGLDLHIESCWQLQVLRLYARVGHVYLISNGSNSYWLRSRCSSIYELVIFHNALKWPSL